MEDTEEMTRDAVGDPAAYATGFGYSGTYWDYVQEIARERGGIEGAAEWILKTMDMVRTLSSL